MDLNKLVSVRNYTKYVTKIKRNKYIFQKYTNIEFCILYFLYDYKLFL
jgi:hypothetical protein